MQSTSPSSANSRRIAAAAGNDSASRPVAAAPRLLIHRPMPESRKATDTIWSDNVRPIPVEHLRGIFAERPLVDLRPARHVVIEPALPLWQVLVMFAVAAFIGVLLATGGVL